MNERISTGDKCVCGGLVVGETYSYSTVPRELAIIGPGSRNQMATRTDYYCESCGISYRFPPSRAKKIGKGSATVLTKEQAAEVRKRLFGDEVPS